MDTLTHCLTGAVLAMALRQPDPAPAAPAPTRPLSAAESELLPPPAPAIPPNRGLLLLMVAASNLPDIDAVMQIWPYGFASRREFFHGILGVPVLSLAAAYLARWVTPQYCFSHRFVLILAASVLHVLMDLPNSFGVALLAPFSGRRFELASVFVVDLVFWGVLAGALLAPRVSRGLAKWRARIAYGALAILACYTAACSGLRAMAQAGLEAEVVAPGETLYVYHEPFGPGLWRGVVRSPDGAAYRVYGYRTLAALAGDRRDAIHLEWTVANDAATTTVARIRETNPDARRVEEFFRSPVWRANDDGTAQLRDLRFSSIRLSGRQPFVFQFAPGK